MALGLGLGIHKFTEGYLYFRKYRDGGYAILRDTHISVTPAQVGQIFLEVIKSELHLCNFKHTKV